MASLVRDRLSLGSSKNSNMVNSRKVSCQIDVSNWKIPKQMIDTIYQIGKLDFDTALSINVISKPFEINKDYLRQNFNSIENKVKREWFLSHFDLNAQAYIRQQWYSFMERHQVNVTFFN